MRDTGQVLATELYLRIKNQNKEWATYKALMSSTVCIDLILFRLIYLTHRWFCLLFFYLFHMVHISSSFCIGP